VAQDVAAELLHHRHDRLVRFPDREAVHAQTGFLLRKVSSASFNAFSEIRRGYLDAREESS
jgi:hypothetical protein